VGGRAQPRGGIPVRRRRGKRSARRRRCSRSGCARFVGAAAGREHNQQGRQKDEDHPHGYHGSPRSGPRCLPPGGSLRWPTRCSLGASISVIEPSTCTTGAWTRTSSFSRPHRRIAWSAQRAGGSRSVGSRRPGTLPCRPPRTRTTGKRFRLRRVCALTGSDRGDARRGGTSAAGDRAAGASVPWAKAGFGLRQLDDAGPGGRPQLERHRSAGVTGCSSGVSTPCRFAPLQQPAPSPQRRLVRVDAGVLPACPDTPAWDDDHAPGPWRAALSLHRLGAGVRPRMCERLRSRESGRQSHVLTRRLLLSCTRSFGPLARSTGRSGRWPCYAREPELSGWGGVADASRPRCFEVLRVALNVQPVTSR